MTPQLTTRVIGDEEWELSGMDEDRSGRLYAELSINGYRLHLEAFAVTELGDYGQQKAADASFDDQVDAVLDQFVEGAASTVSINGRDYILVATPYQA